MRLWVASFTFRAILSWTEIEGCVLSTVSVISKHIAACHCYKIINNWIMYVIKSILLYFDVGMRLCNYCTHLLVLSKHDLGLAWSLLATVVTKFVAVWTELDTNQYKAFSSLEGINKDCLELELTFLQLVIYCFVYIFSSWFCSGLTDKQTCLLTS
jgi:uncharacterized membrane protein